MKKFKNGFTLMETLIALGIAGVVAALLVPQLIKQIEKNKAGANLARTVEQIELGVQNYIQAKNDKNANGSYATKLSELNGIDFDKLTAYMGLTKEANSGINFEQYSEYAFLPNSLFIPSAYAVAKLEKNLCADKYALYDTTCVDPDTPVKPLVPEEEDIYKGETDDDEPKIPLKPIINPIKPIPIDWPTGDDTADEEEQQEDIPTEFTDAGTAVTSAGLSSEYDNATLLPSGSAIRAKSSKTAADVLWPSNFSSTSIKEFVKNSDKKDPVVAAFMIDVNGSSNNPNMHGKDAFTFNLTDSGKVLPYGKADDCTDTITNGRACTARVVKDGYRIKY